MEGIYAPKEGPPTSVLSLFDFERYLGNYQGNTKFNRLLHWLQQEQYRNVAYDLLVMELLRSCNTVVFRKLVDDKILNPDGSLVGSFGYGNNGPFEEWISSSEKTLHTTLSILENELTTAKSTTVKESIRIAYCELGNLYYKWGKLEEAFKAFLRARDYCSMPKHHSDIAYQLILVTFDMKQYYNANNFVNKLLDVSTDPAVQTRGKVVQALLFVLNEGNYHTAAIKFLELTQGELPSSEVTSVLSIYDVGFYTFILCLATMSYAELKQKLGQNRSFLNDYIAGASSTGSTSAATTTGLATASAVGVAEAGSQTPGSYNPYKNLKLKQLLQDILNNSFESIFQSLPMLYAVLSVDIYFKHHAHYLLKLIIEKMTLQFLLPYQTVSLAKIQSFFHFQSMKQLKSLLISLISSGKLVAKIDSTNQLLIKHSPNPEKQLYDQTYTLMQKNITILKRGLLRNSLQRYGFVVDLDQGEASGMSMGGKMKRLQDLHEQQGYRRGNHHGPKSRGKRSKAEPMMMNVGTTNASSAMIHEMDEEDYSDREDDIDEEMMMVLQKEHSREGEYYSADDDM